MSGPIVDPNNEPGDLPGLEKSLAEAITARKVSVQDKVQAPQADVDTSLPEKYRGKSIQDVIAMHQHAEQLAGNLGNEAGRLKSLTDQLLDLKRSEDLVKGGAREQEEELPQITSTDILDNPTEAIARVVAAVTKRESKGTQQKMAELELKQSETAFFNKYPDAAQVTNDPKFQEWVKASPSRRRTANQAYQQDYSAAADLLDEWKSSTASTIEVVEQKSEAPKDKGRSNLEAAKKAATVKASANSSSDSTSTGKIFRRADLIELKLKKPSVYGDPAVQAEIVKAYAEGRVR